MRRLLLVATAAAALLVMVVPAAWAHPLGNFTVNRYSGLMLSPGRVELTYVVDMAEIPTYQETPRIDTDGDGVPVEAERQAWARREAASVLGQVSVAVGGIPVELTVRSFSMTFRQGQGNLPTLYFRAVFAGELPASGLLRYQDANYQNRVGWSEVTAASADGVAISGSTVPGRSISDELTAYPKAALSSPLAVTSGALSFAPGRSTGPLAAAASGPVSRSPVTSGASFAALVNWKLTPPVLLLSVLLAFGFGALHALGPGHGKTITAAYLVGKGARVRQAAAAGLAVAFMHTASVLALGLVALVLFQSFPAERIYPWLGLLTGLVAFGLGIAMLVLRVRSRRGGVDSWTGHAHGHQAGHHPHVHDEQSRVISRKGLAALAVSGGLLPSPTALVVLTAAAAYHRIGYGLVLIVSFSLGLASALIAVGLLALRARAMVSRRLGSRVAGILPVVSAALIIGVGLFFVARGLSQVA